MAGLIGLTAADIDVQDALQAPRWAFEGDWVPHPVVRLTTTLPIAVHGEEGTREIVRARWGFPIGKGRTVGNCRDDRLTQSPLWSSMLGKSPCLVACSGVYEMVQRGADKQSFWFRRTDGQLIVMPGLCSTRQIDGQTRLCCATVTTEPNNFFAQFHDRQVCQVDPDQADAWMQGEDPDNLLSLLHPPPEDGWEAVPVDNRIFASGPIEDVDLIQTGEPIRLGDTPPGQQTLF